MLTIPSQHRHIFLSAALTIERKLLELQVLMEVHKYKHLRFVLLEYDDTLKKDLDNDIRVQMNHLYDLLQEFCKAYDIPISHVSYRKEIMVKCSFLWEDITGINPRHIQHYDDIGDEIKTDYEARLQKMTQEAEKLLAIFKK